MTMGNNHSIRPYPGPAIPPCGCIVGSAHLQWLTWPMPPSPFSPSCTWERARLLVVVHFIFHLVLTLIHSFPFLTQVDCYFEWLIVGISPPAVQAVAAASGCSGRILVSAHCQRLIVFIYLFCYSLLLFWFFFSCSGEWRKIDPHKCLHKWLIVSISPPAVLAVAVAVSFQ